jgi:alpha-galactosidase
MSNPIANDSEGHAAHTQASESRGLPGRFGRPIRITFLGAGSGFCPRLLNDVLRTPGLAGGSIALVDVDLKRLDQMRRLIAKLVASLGRERDWTVSATADRREALPGPDYLINCIEVSGLECVRHDNAIPLKYGIDQCIGDTIGPGGLFKALRTIPVWLGILKDAEELCPGALVLNYTNPMAMLCLAAFRTSRMPVVGLCHSVQGTGHILAARAGVPYEEMEWECSGINHLAWFTRLGHRGVDLYPRLKAMAIEDLEGRSDPDDPARSHDLVRKDMMIHFGAFITESSGHLSEYLPYYRKNPAAIARYSRSGYSGESGFYVANWPRWRAEADASRERMLAGTEPMHWERSWEYASWIIEAREKDHPFRIHGNVYNHAGPAGARLIPNLPDDACVEVPVFIDRNGFNPVRVQALPRQMAALCASNLAVFDLGAQAAIERSRELAFHALLLDPLTAAVCTPAQIRSLCDELFEAEAAHLPGYR